MSYVRKLALYGLLLLMTLIFTGCIKTDYHVRLNKDDSVDVVVTIGLDQSIVDSKTLEGDEIMRGMFDSLADQGFTISDYVEENFVGVRGTKHLASYTDLIDTDGRVIGITRDDSLFFHRYHIQGAFDLSTEDAYSELAEDSLTKFFYDTFDLQFRLTAPGMATDHNATSSIDGALVWELKMAKNNLILAEILVLKPWVIILATLLGLGLLGGLAVLIKRGARPVQKES